MPAPPRSASALGSASAHGSRQSLTSASSYLSSDLSSSTELAQQRTLMGTDRRATTVTFSIPLEGAPLRGQPPSAMGNGAAADFSGRPNVAPEVVRVQETIADAVGEVRRSAQASLKEVEIALLDVLTQHKKALAEDRLKGKTRTHDVFHSDPSSVPDDADMDKELADLRLNGLILNRCKGSCRSSLSVGNSTVSFEDPIASERLPTKARFQNGNPETHEFAVSAKATSQQEEEAVKAIQKASKPAPPTNTASESVAGLRRIQNEAKGRLTAANRAQSMLNIRFHEMYGGDTRELKAQKSVKFHFRMVIGSGRWNSIMAAVIVLNALSIGVDINLKMQDESSLVLEVAEHMFLLIYVFELVITFCAYGWKSFQSSWVRYDFVLIVIGVIASWIIAPIMNAHASEIGEDPDEKPVWVSILEQILILRVLRILRLAKGLRLMSNLDTLGKLLNGMIKSANTMVSAMALILATVYVLACVGGELLITSSSLRDHPEAGPKIEESFGDLPSIMLSLMQFCTADSISSLYVPIVRAQPWFAFYFFTVLAVLCFLLMNLVTAIVVEDAISRATLDREATTMRLKRQLKKQRAKLQKIFRLLDVNEDGEIQLNEMIDGIQDLQGQVPPDLESVLLPDALVDLFDYIDVDQSGTISEKEFVDGIGHLALMTSPVELTQIIHLLRHQRFQSSKALVEIMRLRDIVRVAAANGQLRSQPELAVATASMASSLP